MPQSVYVLWWMYSDNSDAGIHRVYADEDEAKADAELLNERSTVVHLVAEVPFLERRS